MQISDIAQYKAVDGTPYYLWEDLKLVLGNERFNLLKEHLTSKGHQAILDGASVRDVERFLSP